MPYTVVYFITLYYTVLLCAVKNRMCFPQKTNDPGFISKKGCKSYVFSPTKQKTKEFREFAMSDVKTLWYLFVFVGKTQGFWQAVELSCRDRWFFGEFTSFRYLIQDYSVLHNVIQFNAGLYRLRYSTVLHYIILYYNVLYRILCSAVLHYSIL